ncbi:hypothetical protein [Haloplanus pelagicus]|jgi:hypothetical protein|uniref:hypothetical protein n=1 Tax=Haloplanus pelagicus TaxID=2949995 RepID=UPI00203FF2D5|nr:hypothetical protein [Haloplanus sp. HW8-1]
MPSSRRTLLASIGTAAAGLAGCLGPSGSTGSPTSTPTSTATPGSPASEPVPLGRSVDVNGVTVTVSDPAVAHSARYLSAPDAFDVVAAGTDQFLFVTVAAEGGSRPPSPDAFGVVVADVRYGAGIEALGPARVDAPVSGRRYGDAGRHGYLAFRLPAPVATTDLAVVLGEGARWTLPSSAAEALRSPPPAFETGVDVPDAVPADEPIPVTLDVTNAGDGPGVFRGAINHGGPLYSAAGFDLSLASGESTTHEVTVDYHVGSETPPDCVQFAVVGPGVDRSFEVGIEGGGTGTGAGSGTATGTATR